VIVRTFALEFYKMRISSFRKKKRKKDSLLVRQLKHMDFIYNALNFLNE
jgi:hypothetical protein